MIGPIFPWRSPARTGKPIYADRRANGGTHKCILHSLSEHGAKISLESPVAAPERFEMTVGEANYLCRRVWQNDSTIGVEFIDAAESGDAGAEAQQDEPARDKRQHKRVELMRRARIIYNNAFSVIECVILDISDSGARIRPADVLSCPETFKLSIDSGPSHTCSVVRRHGNEIAVQFLDLPEARSAGAA
jgi:hypothetical protein